MQKSPAAASSYRNQHHFYRQRHKLARTKLTTSSSWRHISSHAGGLNGGRWWPIMPTRSSASHQMPPSLLESISSPDDLRALGEGQLVSLASELRAFMIDTVSQTGGHLAPSLGTIELTIALHYVFNTPFDRLIWDVGHQAYAHKILTGRREAMATLRCKGGISGFPKRSETTPLALATRRPRSARHSAWRWQHISAASGGG